MHGIVKQFGQLTAKLDWSEKTHRKHECFNLRIFPGLKCWLCGCVRVRTQDTASSNTSNTSTSWIHVSIIWECEYVCVCVLCSVIEFSARRCAIHDEHMWLEHTILPIRSRIDNEFRFQLFISDCLLLRGKKRKTQFHTQSALSAQCCFHLKFRNARQLDGRKINTTDTTSNNNNHTENNSHVPLTFHIQS